ncbi:MAG TPA: ATP-binding protein [Candidatus Bathyarchaeia archaeon]|nr:ATP-binding protein [Candidatus Bathyarchaeia archaeon]
MKLRLRLVLLLMLPFLLVIGVYSALRVQQESRARVEEERERAGGMARTIQIAVDSALAVRGRPQNELADLLNDLTEGQDAIDQIRILDRDGHVLAASSSRVTAHPASAAAVARAIDVGAKDLVETQGAGGDWWVFILPVQYSVQKGRPPSAATRRALEIAFVAPDTRLMARQAIRDVVVRVGSLTVALALLMALVLQRQVLRPLANLAQSIRALGEGRRGPPLPVKRHDELGLLAEAFNRMTEQLEEARQRLVTEAEYALDLEQQLRRAETLAVAGKLASGIAHEVGTPLNIISGRAEMVLRSLPPEHPGRQDLERIIHQIDRVSNIVRSLLDTVRLGKLEIQRVSVETLIGRMLPLLEHVVRKRSISMATSIPADLPNVAGDPGRLQQVFINLLMNAVEATPTDGQITIVAAAAANDGRAGVAVEVTDTGAGIPREALAQVFEPFYTTKPVGEGTGLGLAISRDIIRDHGGSIVARSHPGRGSTFVVWLPEYEVLA